MSSITINNYFKVQKTPIYGSTIPLREAATVGLSTGLQKTACSVESSAEANNIISTSLNIFADTIYKLNTKGPNALCCGMPEMIEIHSLGVVVVAA